jgi:hypothetical protein
MEQADDQPAAAPAPLADATPGPMPGEASPSPAGGESNGEPDMDKKEAADFMSWYGTQFQEEDGDTASPLKLAVVQDEEETPGRMGGGGKRGSVFSFAPNPVSSEKGGGGAVLGEPTAPGVMPTDELGLQAMVFKQAQELDEAQERIRHLEGDVSEKEENLRLTAEIGQSLLVSKSELEHEVADLHEELEHLRGEAETGEKEVDESIQHELHELQAEIKQLRPKLDGSREQISELQKANFTVTQKLQNAESQIQVCVDRMGGSCVDCDRSTPF